MRRREWLALCATLSAGCLGGPEPGHSSPEPPGSEPTASPSPTPTTTEGAPTVAMGETVTTDAGTEVTVGDHAVSKFAVTRDVGSSVHLDVAGDPGAQFLRVTVEASGGGTATPPNRYDSVRPTLDDTLLTDVPARRVDGVEDRYALAVPVDDYEDGFVVWQHRGDPEVRWQLAETTLGELGRTPTFEVRRFGTPDSVSRGDAVEVTLTVAKTGDRDGTFVAEFGDPTLISGVGEVSVDVTSGAETTRNLTDEPPYWEDVSEIELTLDWGYDQVQRTVRVED